jgi:hypothetical protein
LLRSSLVGRRAGGSSLASSLGLARCWGFGRVVSTVCGGMAVGVGVGVVGEVYGREDFVFIRRSFVVLGSRLRGERLIL